MNNKISSPPPAPAGLGSAPLRVLFIENTPGSSDRILDTLRQGGFTLVSQRARGEKKFNAALASQWDLVLSDWPLQGFPQQNPLEIMKKRGLDIPFIIISARADDETMLAALRLGAYDFVLEDRIKRLGGAVINAVRHSRLRANHLAAQEGLLANDERLRALTQILQQPAENTQEFLDIALDQALRMTSSELGYIYFYNEDKQEFTLNTWSREVMRECTIKNPHTMYQLDKTGVWGEAVRQRQPIIVNDFQAPHPLKKGYPAGHAHLKRFLTVPVFSDGNIVAVVGVANKTAEYGDTDVLQLTLLMDSVWKVVDLRRAQETLLASEMKYRTLVENIPMKVFTKDRISAYLSANQNFAHDLGILPGQIVGKTDYDFFPRQLAEKYRADDQRIMAGGKNEDLEELYMIGGNEAWIQTIKTPLYDDLGAVTGLLGIFWDISKRKQAEEALRTSEEKFRMVFETANVGKSITQPDGRVFPNQALAEMLGYTREELIQKTWQDLTPPEEVESVKNRLAPLQEGREDAVRFRKRYIHKNGSTIWADVHVAMLRDDQGKPLNFITTIVDITSAVNNRKSEKLLAERVVAGLRAGNLAWWEMELPSGKVVFDDRKADMIGYSPDDFKTYEDFIRLLHPEDEPKARRAMRDHLEGKTEVYEVEYRIRTRAGDYKWFHEIGAVCDRGPATGYARVIGIVDDITRRKQAEVALEAYSSKLEDLVVERTLELENAQSELVIKEKLATLGHLAGSVGHELRNPLNVISNAVYILQANLSHENEKARQYVLMIKDQVYRSNRIISDLLDFGRDVITTPSELDLSEVIPQVLARQPVPANVKITRAVSRNLPTVLADRQHVEQVLINLAENAFQAMPDGGEVRVSASLKKDGVHISMRDHGCGISPENMTRLFTPLFTTKTNGIGLGLSICKKLAEADGGRLTVKSTQGQGSTFTLILPEKKAGQNGP